MNDYFKIGKLYKTTEEVRNGRGMGSHLFFKPPEESTTKEYFSEEDVILVLDKLYVQRTKRRNLQSNWVTVQMWHLKVLVDNHIGYVSVWEDEWEECKE